MLIGHTNSICTDEICTRLRSASPTAAPTATWLLSPRPRSPALHHRAHLYSVDQRLVLVLHGWVYALLRATMEILRYQKKSLRRSTRCYSVRVHELNCTIIEADGNSRCVIECVCRKSGETRSSRVCRSPVSTCPV